MESTVAKIIAREAERQSSTIELIASENHVSPAVMEAVGSCLTNKYAEGYPGKRYYGGCQNYEEVERLAQERARQLFGCAYANVQPHSGASANIGSRSETAASAALPPSRPSFSNASISSVTRLYGPRTSIRLVTRANSTSHSSAPPRATRTGCAIGAARPRRY